jgi:ELWxxDGT repeat protein
VRDIRPGLGNSNPSNLTNVNGTLFFVANDGSGGYELWKSNGTSTGTVLVRDIRPGLGNSNPSNLTNVNGTLFFTANDGTNGYELWKSDGTSTGTVLVRDIRSGTASSLPFFAGLTNVNGTLFFEANDGSNGRELWKSNGTSTGTVLVRDIRPGTIGSFPSWLTNVNGTLFFSANDGTNGVELWATDDWSPTIVSVTPPANGTYRAGQVLDVRVCFSEPVNVGTTSTAKPYVELRIGSTIRNAEFHSKPNAMTLRFRYVVQTGDLDTNGIEILSPVMRPSGTYIRDAAGNNVTTTFTKPSTPNVKVDAVAPTIVQVTPPANGHYVSGQVLDILVRFSEPVTVGTTSTAKPYIRVRISNRIINASVVRKAVFVGQLNANTLLFRYVIQHPEVGDTDHNGIEILSPVMRPSGTFIRDLAGNDALVTFAPPSTTGVTVN